MNINWPPLQPVGRLCAITMARDEDDFLRQWVTHYRREVPGVGLVIIDHASKHPVADWIGDITANASVSVLRMPDFPFDDRAKAAILSSIAAAMLCGYATVIASDADEILVPLPSSGGRPLLELLDEQTDAFVAPVGIEFIHNPNAESPFDFERPLLEQRSIVRFHSAYSKPVIWNGRAASFGSGQHHLSEPYIFSKTVGLAHLKYVDRDSSRRRQTSRGTTKYSDRHKQNGGISMWKSSDPQTWARDQFKKAGQILDNQESGSVFNQFMLDINLRLNKSGENLIYHTKHDLTIKTNMIVYRGF